MKQREVMKSLTTQGEILYISGFSSDGDHCLSKDMQIFGFRNISTTEPSNNINDISINLMIVQN